MPTDDELSRLAEEALLREAQRGAKRAQISGPSGWLKSRLPSTNKTFLQNTLLGAMASNRAKERQEKSQSERGKRRRQLEERERNTYKRVYLHASTKSKKKPLQDCTEGDEESCIRKESKQRKEESSNQVFMWTDSGLQLTNQSKKVSDTTELKSKDKDNPDKRKKVDDSSLLSRKIKFIPGSDKR